MAGIESLMQGPVPGQAPQQPMPGMMPQQGAPTPAAMVGPLSQMHMQQLVQMMLNPRPDGPPLYAVISAISEQQKKTQAQEAVQRQLAMGQGQQAAQQPPVAAQIVQAAEQMQRPTQMAAHGGIMHGYAGGGAVAFTDGTGPEGLPQQGSGMDPYALYEAARKYGIDLPLYDQDKRAEAIQRVKTMMAEETSPYSHETLVGLRSKPTPPLPASAPAATGIAGARRPPAGNKPPATGQGLGALGSAVEQTGTPAPDTLSDIESKGIAGIRGVQDVYRQQGTVDPELMKLREAAYKSSQDIAARRERDRQAAMEAAQKQYEDPTDLLLDIAGSAGGKTVGEVLGGAARGASGARTRKRAEFQKAQEISRQEQNAIDTLNQALADKRVADETGNVAQRREADRRVAEAELKVTELRSGIQKERAAEADRAAQREIGRITAAAHAKTADAAMLTAQARATSNMAEQRIALQAMRADPNYAAIVKELTEAKKMAGVSSSPTLQARLQAAEKAARDLATAYGVTPGMMGMGGAGPAAPEGRVVDFNAIGKK